LEVFSASFFLILRLCNTFLHTDMYIEERKRDNNRFATPLRTWIKVNVPWAKFYTAL